MAYKDCINRLQAAAGRQLTDKEVSAIFERIHKAALDIKAGRKAPGEVGIGAKLEQQLGAGKPEQLFIQKAAQRAAAELQAEALLHERQAQLQIVRLGARQGDVKTIQAAGLSPLDAVEATIVRDFSGRLNVESLEQKATGYRDYFNRRLLDVWDSLGNDYLGFFQNQTKLLDLVRELRGEDTGNALAKKGAKAFHEVAEEARQVFNANGGAVGKLDDWGMPQHHSQERVAAAGRDAWTDSILPLVDRGRYLDEFGQSFTDSRMREFLGKAWDTIATNGHANTKAGQNQGVGKRSNRHAEERQIHFKDAQANIDYWNSYGERTVVEILANHVETMARDIAFVEHFGPNPDITYKTLRDQALTQAAVADPTQTTTLEGRAVKLDSLYDYSAGRIKPTYRQWLRQTADGIAHLNIAGKLGGAALASLFGDKPMMEAVSHMNDIPMIQRWRSEVSLLNPANTADRRLLQTNGLMVDSIRSGLQRFYEGLGQSSTTGRIANAVMRVTGMQAINEIRKGAFGLNAMAAIGHQLAKKTEFSALGDTDVRLLKTWGITEADWKIWQLAKLDTMVGVDNVLTSEGISRIADADIANVVGTDIKAAQEKLGSQVAELLNRNAQEDARLATKIGDVKAFEARLADRLNKFMTTRDAKVQQAGEMFKAQIDLMRAKLERAGVEADMNAYLLRIKERGQATEMVDAILADKDPNAVLDQSDKRGDKAGTQRGNIGEKLGERRGNTERRVVEMEAKLRQMERDASAEVKAKYVEMIGQVGDQLAAIDEWHGQSQKRIERRQHVVDRLLGEASAAEKTVGDTARRNAIVKLLGVVNTESEFAIVTPGWKERAAFHGTVQRGTVPGEIWRSVLQFKSFPWAMFQRGMDAVANMDGPTSKAIMTSYLIASTTLAGAMLMQTRELLSGKDPLAMADKNWHKFWGKAFLQGGALGLYGDFLYNSVQTRMGSGPIEALAGPTLGPLLELGLVQPMTALAKRSEGKQTHLAAQTIADLKGFVPGNNIWYLKAAMEHLVWQRVMEWASPGYLNQMRQRTQRDFNQQWWWQPGETTPDRAPDFARAVE